MQTCDQVADHFEAETAASGENLGNTASTAQEGHQILIGEALLRHAETNRRHRVRLVDWENLFLVLVN